MRLDGGALDVDGLAAFASLFVSDKGANRFADRDLDFQIKAGPVSAGGLTADTVDTALRLRDGLLEIDRLSVGGLAGASISATGTDQGFPGEPDRQARCLGGCRRSQRRWSMSRRSTIPTMPC